MAETECWFDVVDLVVRGSSDSRRLAALQEVCKL